MPAEPSPATAFDGQPSVAAHAMAATRAADARIEGAVADVFLSQQGRLDDRTRWAVTGLAEATVRAIERQVAGTAARDLAAAGAVEAASLLESNDSLAWPRLLETGLMQDEEVIGELLAQARIDLIDESLAALRAPDAGPTLLTVLAGGADARVRGAAVTYLAMDSRRRLAAGERRAGLPARLQRRVAWWIAAALRERLGQAGGAAADRALAEATQRFLLAHDDDARVEVAAMRLAEALDAPAERLAMVLLEALEGARMTLFVALLARALAIDATDVRTLALDSASDRLWLALRAAGLGRDAIARIGFLLSEADRERDVEALPDMVDTTAALAPDAAADSVAPLRLPRAFRAAMRTLDRHARA